MEDNESDNQARLDGFFDMFDSVEDDIADLISDENEKPLEIGGYECLIIAFSNMSIYCENAGILLKQIEDQYKELKESQGKEGLDAFATHENLDENNEIVNFCKILERIEDSFSALEKRSQKSGENFDEWACLLIMYSYLRNFCEKEEVDFDMLQKEISRIHSEMDKDKNS
ncbi:MAG: hypothetical protein HN472_02220 [Nitrospina sp.]|jgi:hypothetical protein|nr:hypothetical protein [Nitrospina sp.]MBT3874714.1 hypothetical protein [Nitrospina sp.]MBT4049448.1 hypothetical protein [Nitrospina sp.]MBT4558382.1 hypothetical protein [Nitrospina sp.]MBT5348927.1 hypothetical protein [Nitrospina sp.]